MLLSTVQPTLEKPNKVENASHRCRQVEARSRRQAVRSQCWLEGFPLAEVEPVASISAAGHRHYYWHRHYYSDSVCSAQC